MRKVCYGKRDESFGTLGNPGSGKEEKETSQIPPESVTVYRNRAAGDPDSVHLAWIKVDEEQDRIGDR